MTTHLRVKNFERLQHYRDRRPPWIKLPNGLLDDYTFAHLADVDKWHLVAIWLLASRSDNCIPNDAAWISRMIAATETPNIERLISAGFLEPCEASEPLAGCFHDARLEGEVKERRKEVEGEARRSPVPSGRAARAIQPDIAPQACNCEPGIGTTDGGRLAQLHSRDCPLYIPNVKAAI